MVCYINDDTFQRLSLSEPLSSSGLSVRVCTALANENIRTLQDLLNTSRYALNNIRGLGQKGLNELLDFLHHVWSYPIGQKVYPLTEEKAKKLGIASAWNGESPNPKKIPLKIRQTPLENLNLSVRAYNSLHKAGHCTLDDVLKLSRKELLQIRSLGVAAADEIIRTVTEIIQDYIDQKHNDPEPVGPASIACQRFMRSIFMNVTVHDMDLYRVIFREFKEADEQGRPVNYEMLYENRSLRDAVWEKITQVLDPFPFGLDKDILYQALPAVFMLPKTSFDSILHEMDQTGFLRIHDKISVQRMSILELASSIQDDRLRDMLIKRLNGVPLKVIASQYGISKERVRQVVLNGIRKFNLKLEEDKYIPVFEKYLFTKAEFMQTFGERTETFYYLTIVCNKTKRLPISKFTGDPTLPEEILQSIRSLFLQDFIYIDGEKVEHNRVSLTKHVVQTRFRGDVSFDDLVDTYNHVLTQYGLDTDPSLTMNTRSYINHLRRVDFLLWQPGYTMRYYEINSRNYDDLMNTLQLDQYHDTEYSARKFFLAEPDLMQKYDIRNEHELHNLLRKICENYQLEHIRFLRTPNISFGKSNRFKQVYDILLQYSPMTQHEFMVKYGEVYGIDPENTNPVFYLKPFREYFHDGVYDVRTSIKEDAETSSLRQNIPVSRSDFR